MKKYFDAVIAPGVEELELLQEEWEFWKLAKKYSRHDRGTCKREDCMICHALQQLEARQYELAAMHEGRDLEINPQRPF